jgi:YVTN family beta-propeller protein
MMRHGLAGLFLLAPFSAAALPADTLIVLNKSDHNAALVNPRTREAVARVSTGQGPHEAAVSPDGKFAYVTNYGSFRVFQQGERPRMEPGRSITVIDLKKRAVHATFDLGEYRQPHGIAVSRNGKLLWVTAEAHQSVLELDARDGKVLQAWKTEQRVSHMVAPSRDEKKLYVANIGSGSVSVIHRVTGKVATLPTAAGAEGIALAPDGKTVWVTNRAADSISVIDTATDTVATTFSSSGKFPIRVKFTPDGKLALVSNAQSNRVTVFDAATRRPLADIEVGMMPVGIQVTPDGKRAYVANTNANLVSVLDIAARKVLGTFSTGTEPDGMAWAK